MSRLHEQLWMTPEDPGPSRRSELLTYIVVFLACIGWVTWPAGNLREVRGGKLRPHVIVVDDDGSATADGDRLDTEVRALGETMFLVIYEQLQLQDDRPVDIRVDAPPSVSPNDVAVRRILPHGGRSGRDGEVLVTMPLKSLPGAEQVDAAPELDAVTVPFDSHAAEVRQDLKLQQRLQVGWWWIVPFVFGLGTWLPLMLWRRSASTFFSMRLPGPGKEFGAEPPSAIDPVGAAILRAGVGAVDYVAAFLGATFDLVERRQVGMSRTTDHAMGGAGALLVLAPAQDGLGTDEPVAQVLRSVADPDGVTVPVPDLPDDLRAVPDTVWDAWCEHVDARARFERVVDVVDTTRQQVVAVAAGVFGVIALIGSFIVGFDGQHAAGLAGALLALPCAVTCWRWARDARRWRVVARRRRNERAQWLAWRRVIGTPGGPDLDVGRIPVVVATGLVQGLIHDTAGSEAVGLDAITGSTLRSMRGMIRSRDR